MFVVIGYFILIPKQYEPLETTILCGKIESLSKFKNGYLIHPTISDTIASFKIINNDNYYSESVVKMLNLAEVDAIEIDQFD